MPRRLLELFLPEHAALAGDLHEEFGRRGSAWWYWRQALAAVAIHVTAGIAARPLLALRAAAAGWTTLWLFSFVGVEINRFMSGWFLDRLILLFWTHPFPMMWATQLSYRPALALGYLISGWTVARLHRTHRPAMLVAFTMTVLLWTGYDEVQRSLTRSTPVLYPVFDVVFAPLPLLILVGGVWSARRPSS
ncbi:MAG: hypothetical protein FJW14_18630 [Acidimicrobiia bacterium]|nr:hypothetical protein [Acidimicrobiia bacterium]